MAIVITIDSEVGPIHSVEAEDGQLVVPVHGLGIDVDGVYLAPEGAVAGEAAWLKLDPITGAPSAVLKGA